MNTSSAVANVRQMPLRSCRPAREVNKADDPLLPILDTKARGTVLGQFKANLHGVTVVQGLEEPQRRGVEAMNKVLRGGCLESGPTRVMVYLTTSGLFVQSRISAEILVRKAIPDVYCICIAKRAATFSSHKFAIFMARDASQADGAALQCFVLEFKSTQETGRVKNAFERMLQDFVHGKLFGAMN